MMEAILTRACLDHGLSGIGVNIFNSRKPVVTVYLHWGNGACSSATAATFEQAVASALVDRDERLGEAV